ncbi:hypothetical protein GCM10009850_045180 [Nonomuraea monospora]|uniref:Secreted protein n=1 Tax=Nonomuraea monospora TaxID=568818 RepID=A0ABN3CIY3_9ACTN
MVAAAGAVLGPAAPASAHTVTAGADLRIAQTIAGAEVTVVIKGTSRVPGPLSVGVIAYQPVSGLPVSLQIRSVEDGHSVTGAAQAAADPAYTQLRVERTGPHELTLRAGDETAVIPFRVLVERESMGELLIYGGLFLAAMLLVGGLLTGATARPGRAMALAAGAAAGVTVAAMVIVFEPGLPAPPPDGAAPTSTAAQGRPYVQSRVETVPARPGAGEEFTLRVDLIDGSTGRPVDDLTAHHEALAHVVVTSQDGRYFRHVHPLRTAPGRLEVRLSADRPGRYLAYVELEREDSGGQLLPAHFEVAATTATSPPATTPASPQPDAPQPDAIATPQPATPASPHPGATATPSLPPATSATPRLQPATPIAGRPTTIELDTPPGVRPWLGMTGHLLLRDETGGFFGHVHEMGTPGSRVRFTFTFPAPGRYLAWIQYATADRIVTAPFTVDVAAAEAR